MASNAVAVANGAATIVPVETPGRGTLTPQDLETLRATVFKGATDAQLRLYARTCQSRGLDPFSKEIYGWSGRDGAVEIVVGIDGLRNLAESSGEYRGQLGPWFCGEDGQWTDVWLSRQPPLAAKVTVLRANHEPMTDIALLSEFKKNTPTWNSMPTRMLAKCAEANAIRRMFPRQASGLYVREEMERDDRPSEPTLVAPPLNVAVSTAPQPTPAVNLNDDIKRLRESLGWSAQDVVDLAKDNGWNPRSREGLQAIHDRLQEYVNTAIEDDSGAEIIDAEYQPVMPGMPAEDRWTDG